MSRRRTIIRMSAVLASLALGWACGGDSATAPPTPEPARPTTVTVSPATHELTALGTTVQLSAEVRDQNARVMAGVTVTWTSSANSVATVDATGLVTGVGAGEAEITATAGSASGRAELVVVAPVPRTDRDLLEVLYNATGGPEWANSENWLTGAPLREWYGVSVDDQGGVIGLDLTRNKLTGPIPSALAELANLEWVRFGDNELTGVIPPTLGDIANLRELLLERNMLAGPVPPNLGKLSLLRQLSLGGNQDLAGPIPPELGSLGNLEDLFLGGTSLSGSIPSELGGLPNLKRLAIGSTNLSGSIPPELGDLAKLERLYLFWTDVDGPIPPELGSLGSLRELHLHGNLLTGPIPPELGHLTTLEQLYLPWNDLTGPIPPELGDLAHLEWLHLNGNALTGPIPPEIGNLGRLTQLHLQDNALTGPVPMEFGGLTDLRDLVLRGNPGMSGALPLSLARLRSLATLHTGQTDLCAPSDASFLQWLEGLPDRRVAICSGEFTSAYLVQAVQSPEFPVPLVADREALLRVFVTAQRGNDARLPPVRASFYLGGALAHVTNLPGKQGPVPTEVVEGSLASTTNVVIPPELVRPGLEMVVEIDPERTLDPDLGIATRIPETGRITLDVRPMPVLDLTLVPFLWAEAPDEAILSAVEGMADDPVGHELLWHTRTLLPIGGLEVTAHEPVVSLSNDPSALLSQTAAIRAMEGADGNYMGLMSGITEEQGLAHIAGSSSFSVPDSRIMAHELGHNLSLDHPPGTTGSGVDLNYPHPDRTIGAWGYNFGDGGGLVPPDWFDLMSYGRPGWISDYHFSKALRYWQADGGASRVVAAATRKSLLLWGGTNAAGAPYLEPAFVVDAPPAFPRAGGEYRIAVMGADGHELFSFRFDMLETADGDGSSSFAFVLPTDPGWAGTLSSITLSGPAGSVILDGESNLPMAILRNPRTGQVRGILRDLPPTLVTRAAADAGAGPGLEVVFSRGIPDAAAWRR